MSELNIENDKATKPADAADASAPKAAAAQAKGKRYTISIPKDERNVRDVYVCPNFKPMLLKRGVKIDVGQDVIDALENAKETRYFPEEDERGRKTLVPQEVLSYPYQIVGR